MNYHIPAHVQHRAVHDEVVILDTKNDVYLGLNGSAAIVWSEIAQSGSAETALQALLARFDVSEAEARRDVHGLLAELEHRALIMRAS